MSRKKIGAGRSKKTQTQSIEDEGYRGECHSRPTVAGMPVTLPDTRGQFLSPGACAEKA